MEWISVKDDLPKNDDTKIVTIEYDDEQFKYCGRYIDKNFAYKNNKWLRWDDDRTDYFDVLNEHTKIVAWMDEPEPYKGE